MDVRPEQRHRRHFVRVAVQLRQYPDGALSIFHGPRRLADYASDGTLLTERRRHAPRGREGGADGAPGKNLLDGNGLPSKSEGNLAPGSRLRVETPGGGGHLPA